MNARRSRAVYFAGAGLVVFGLVAALVFSHSMRHLHQSQALSGPELIALTSIEPIDAHVHIIQTSTSLVELLEHLHMHVLDILYVDDTDPSLSAVASSKQEALEFVLASAGHARFCTSFDPYRFNKPDFSRQAITALDEDFARGAVASKLWKNLGMEITNASGAYVMPDDPRLGPIYRDVAAHNKTLIVHAADPDEAWGAIDPYGFQTNYFQMHPEWDMSKKANAPSKKSILDARDRVLAANSDLRVIGAHFGSLEDDLDGLATRLDRYPNFAVDTAGRVRRLVHQPVDKVRAFIVKYQDRILYGTDLRFDSKTPELAAVRSWETQYALDWRYFSTDSTFEYRGHKVKGLNLPRPVLRKLYRDNAVRWVPGIAGD